jgi:two-component system, OmpR family, KDP operon response regulator KdpE
MSSGGTGSGGPPVAPEPRGRGPMILLVEDDEDTREALRRDMTARGYTVVPVPDARTALDRWEARRPDLVVLDLGLPDMDGIRVLRRVRREAATPVVILSARGEEAGKIEALEAGADDYVTKPFAIGELHARIRAVLRRAGGAEAAPDGELRAGPLVLDTLAHEVRLRDRRVDLTPREFEILRVLLSHPGRLVTRGRLLRAVWGEAYQQEHHYLHVHVSQLRRKLAAADPEGELRTLIVAEPGVGYRVRAADGG